MGSQFYLQSPTTSTSSLPYPLASPESQSTQQMRSPSPQTPRTPRQATHHQQTHLTINTSTNPTSANSSQVSPTYHPYNPTYDDNSDDDGDDSLPFPAPLPRSDFLTPGDFSPTTYLTTLAKNRYQTLEDLRLELRARVQALNDELVALVNGHQEEFMSLGASLRGGEERVEEVRVGVLGLRREVGEVLEHVKGREREVERALGERRRIREEVGRAQGLLAFGERLGEMEGKLGLKQAGRRLSDVQEGGNETSDEEDEEAEEEGGADVSISMNRLTRRTEDLLRIARLAERVGDEHPFIQAQRPRVAKCREVLLADLNTSLKRLKNTNSADPAQKMRLLRLYREVRFGEGEDEVVEWL